MFAAFSSIVDILQEFAILQLKNLTLVVYL